MFDEYFNALRIRSLAMQCRVCDSNQLELVLDLGQQPWGNHFLTESMLGKEPFYPLRLVYCLKCYTAQLDFTVPKETMFGNHTYLSGITQSLSKHFRQIAQIVDQRFFSATTTKSVLDIGSNDGTQLKHFQDLGYEILGVESSEMTAALANQAGIPTLNAFFNQQIVSQLNRQFDCINASGVFFHLEELHSVCQAIKDLLTRRGVFVVQFLYMKNIMENCAFDQIYHEHLLYYTLETIEKLLNRHGLALFDADWSPIHGGSIIGFISHTSVRDASTRLNQMRLEEEKSNCNSLVTYQQFAQRTTQVKQENLRLLKQFKEMGRRVYGLGAPVKGNTLLNYFGVGPDLIECLVEKNNLRRGLYAPGSHIPIVIENDLQQHPDVYYVLAWNFKDEILKNYKKLIDQNIEFYFPVTAQNKSRILEV
jgi:SAM-dependent methyltransferase